MPVDCAGSQPSPALFGSSMRLQQAALSCVLSPRVPTERMAVSAGGEARMQEAEMLTNKLGCFQKVCKESLKDTTSPLDVPCSIGY